MYSLIDPGPLSKLFKKCYCLCDVATESITTANVDFVTQYFLNVPLAVYTCYENDSIYCVCLFKFVAYYSLLHNFLYLISMCHEK